MVRSRCRLVSGTLNNSERAPSSGPPTEAYPQAPAGANPTAAIHGTLRWSFIPLPEHFCYRQVPPTEAYPQAPAEANPTAAIHGTLRWSFYSLLEHLCYRQVPPDGHTGLSKRALPPCQTVELIGTSGLPARRHTRLSVALARAMVIALRELFLQPGVQHDEEISAPHLLQLQLRFAGCAIGPRDWKLRECIAAHDGLQR